MFFKRIKIRSYETGLYFRDGEFKGLLGEGRHWLFDPLGKVRVDVANMREAWLAHDKLDMIFKSGALKDCAVVMDLKDHQRGLVWIEGRFSHLLAPGLYAYWTGQKDVHVEVVDGRQVRFEHEDLKVIAATHMATQLLDICTVDRDRVSVLFIDGRYIDTLRPGLYAFWKGAADARVVEIDMRETTIDVSGQEIMTADKVSLRMNALVTYRIADARKAVSSTDDVRQALYRETQLALRAIVGVRELDVFLSDKDVVAQEIEQAVRRRAGELGLSVVSVGIRDVILPGDMKDLMNKVTEAKKAAEANLITRREETAAMRSQAGHRPLGWSGQAAGRQPNVDASAGTGSPRKDRLNRQPERRARRKGSCRSRGQLVVAPTPLVRAIGPRAFSFCSSERLSSISARPHDILGTASRAMNLPKN